MGRYLPIAKAVVAVAGAVVTLLQAIDKARGG